MYHKMKKFDVALLYVLSFVNFLNVYLNRRQLSFIVFSYFLLNSVCSNTLFWLKYEKMQPYKKYIVGERRSMLIAFPNNYVYYFLLPPLKPVIF